MYDDQTEVLTDVGWIKFPEYQDKNLVGTVNPNSQLLEFQQPTNVIRLEYKGVIFNSIHNRLNFAITPNHKMYIHNYGGDNWKFIQIENLGWQFSLLHSPLGYNGSKTSGIKTNKRDISGDDWVSLIAVFVSDGWLEKKPANKNKVSFCCFNKEMQSEVRELASRLNFTEQKSKPGVWSNFDEEIAEWFRKNAYTRDTYKSLFKKVPSIIKTISEDQVNKFLHFFGDRRHTSHKQMTFYSGSKQMIDDLQELHLRIGIRSSIYETMQKDRMMPDGKMQFAREDKKKIQLTLSYTKRLCFKPKPYLTTENYCGKVFGVKVENGLLVTRRNNTVFISGDGND